MSFTLPQIQNSKFKVFLIVLLVLVVPITSVSARSITDIQEEIDSQQQSLNELENEINGLKTDLSNQQAQLGSASSELENLQVEISSIQKEISINELELQLISDQIKLKQLEKSQKEISRNINLEIGYLDWRVQDVQAYSFLGKSKDLEKNREYDSFLIDEQQKQITELFKELLTLDLLVDEYNQKLVELEEKNKELDSKKLELEKRLAEINSIIYSSYSQLGSLQDHSSNIQKQISQLQEEQKLAFEREKEILENDPGGGGGDISEGQWYFYGTGRDLYQGHGVGLSQWGAHGLAKNGYSYSDILTFYYAGTQISSGINSNINVQGYGNMSLDTYAAGLGEVPDKACGSSEQVSQNPAKYVVDNPSTSWDCWPEEAIKAQVVAAKAYAYWYNSVYGSICTSASCQVYVGGNAKAWAATETAGMVVTYSGTPIEAVYSSDNSQGYGTADNDTIWQNFSGNGTAYAYLRAANDSGLATQTQWTNWAYQTNGFGATDIDSLLNYIANSANYSASIRNEAQSIINQIGNVSTINFVRDPSLRVKKVVLVGTNGQTREMGGWWFKNTWNSWSYDTGRLDYIYSQTFFLSQ